MTAGTATASSMHLKPSVNKRLLPQLLRQFLTLLAQKG